MQPLGLRTAALVDLAFLITYAIYTSVEWNKTCSDAFVFFVGSQLYLRRRAMPTLRFTLRPGNVSRLHDVLTCLAKFNEVVGFEAQPDRVGILRITFCFALTVSSYGS